MANITNADVFLYKYENNTITLTGVVDDYTSMIFERSYSGIGEWQLVIDGNSKNIEEIKHSNIIRLDDKCCGIISEIVDERTEDGYILTVKGVELKGLTQKRIIYEESKKKFAMKAAPEDIVISLLKRNLGTDAGTARKIDFVIDDFTLEKSETLDYDARYKNLAEEIQALCETYNIGWYAYLSTSSENTERIHFKFYRGLDRTYEQNDNDRLIISYSNDNLKGFIIDEMTHPYNVAYVAGQGEDDAREVVAVGTDSGWNRSELYVDARDVEKTKDLAPRGKEKLAEYGDSLIYEAQPSMFMRNLYREAYDLGDMGSIEKDGMYITTQLTAVTEVFENNSYNPRMTFGHDASSLAAALKRLQGNSNALVYLDPKENQTTYTADEVKIGTYGGKDLYRMTYNVEPNITASPYVSDFTLPEYDTLMSFNWVVGVANNKTTTSFYYVNSYSANDISIGGTTVRISLWIDTAKKVHVRFGGTLRSVVLTLEYTK